MNISKRKKAVIAGVAGASVITAGGLITLGGGFDAAPLSKATDAINGTTIKWSSIVVGIGLVVFFLIRNGVLANENIEEGERGFRRRWGKITTNRKGERTLLLPGKKHFYIRHMYDVVVQSVRVRNTPEEPKYGEPARATLGQTNIWYVLRAKWHVIDEDEAIYKSLTKVYQVNRANEGNDALENYVMNEVYAAVRRSLPEFERDSEGLPVFTVNAYRGHVPYDVAELVMKLEMDLGVSLDSIDPVLLTVAPEAGVHIQ